MKRIEVLALAIAAGMLALADAKPAPETLDALLVAAMNAPATVSYTGTVEVVHFGGRTAEATVYRVEHLAGTLTRRVYVAPSSVSGDAIVLRGDSIFSIDSKHRRIVESRGDTEDSMALDDALLRRNYRAERTGAEEFAGRPVIDLTLVNRYSGRPTLIARIDALTKLVLERKEFAADGALLSEMRFEEIRYPASIPAADFALPQAYDIVHGTTSAESFDRPERIVADAGFAAWEPLALPDGFSPVKAALMSLHGMRTVHLFYSDGLRTVSLFESANESTLEAARFSPQWLEIAGRRAEYAEDGGTALLSWSDGRVHYTLVGDAGLVDLRVMAAAITR
jgi:negative regulator of sigma E activity